MNLLAVEDIIDQGLMMVKLLQVPMGYKSESLRVASLEAKCKVLWLRAQYIALNVQDKCTVEYNLDYNDYFRELNHVCIISGGAKRKFSVPAKELLPPHRQIAEEESN